MAKKKSQIGLDIGSHSLKVVELLADQSSTVVKNIGLYELPTGSLEQTLPKGLDTLLEKNNINAKEVNISISGPGVVIRSIELPSMPESELSGALVYEAEKYIPFDAKDIVLDHTILGKDPAKKKIKVLLVGAKKDIIDSRIKLLQGAGLSPNVIDVDSFAIFNAFLKSAPEQNKDNKTVAFLNIGARLTNIIITCGDLPLMARDINVGGLNLTKALQDKLSINAADAQKLKHNPGPRKEEVLTKIRDILQRFTDEVRLSFTYYENQYGKGVEEVYISGGSSSMDGLATSIKQLADLDVKRWDPFASFEIDPQVSKETLEKLKSSLAVASGLALRG